ncbi:MAG: hypothetical protein RBS68_03410 [Anaerolineales bacterium]|jgi:hypothetical protein|nr:hypothetical protein [Anaerolineales bacterium]
MRNSSLFWGFLLIAVGGLFGLQAMGLVDDITNFLWPLFLMALGAWILFGALIRPKTDFSENESFSIDLQGAERVEFELNHGAGRVVVTGGAPSGVALSGVEGSGMESKSHLAAGILAVKVDAGPSFLPFLGPEGGIWQFRLTNEVPVSLNIDAGATSMDFDLTDVKLSRFKLDTGASSTSLKLPREGQPYVEIESGAASVDLGVPAGMAARIQVEGGASSVSIEARFAPVGNGLYQSSDFEGAADRAEIHLNGGANSISVHS